MLDAKHVERAKLADKPVGELTALFAQWRAGARWFPPSVLSLDDLNRMIPTEKEMRFPLPVTHTP